MKYLLAILILMGLQASGQALFHGHNKSIAAGLPSDADAAAYIARVEAAGGVLTQAQKDSLHTFVYGLKQAGIYSLMTEIYPFAGGNAAAHALGLKHAFNGTWTGSPAHASSGVTFNGSSYLNTGIAPATNLTDYSHISMYLRTEGMTGGGSGVAFSDNSGWTALLPRFTDGTAYPGITNTEPITHTPKIPTAGLHVLSRQSSTEVSWMKDNGSAFTSAMIGLGSRPTAAIYVGAINRSGTAAFYDTREYAFFSVGASLTDNQGTTLMALVNNLQKAFNRNSY
jgi:hypothetical protein